MINNDVEAQSILFTVEDFLVRCLVTGDKAEELRRRISQVMKNFESLNESNQRFEKVENPTGLSNSLGITLSKVQRYLAAQAETGNKRAGELSAEMLPFFPDTPNKREFTVIAAVKNTGELKVFHVKADDGFQAFGVVAKQEQDAGEKGLRLEFIASLVGRQNEGSMLTLPGESMTCAETILQQPEIFELCAQDQNTPQG